MSDQPSLRDNIRQLFDVQQGLAFVYRHLPWTHRLMQGAWFALLALLAARLGHFRRRRRLLLLDLREVARNEKAGAGPGTAVGPTAPRPHGLASIYCLLLACC